MSPSKVCFCLLHAFAQNYYAPSYSFAKVSMNQLQSAHKDTKNSWGLWHGGRVQCVVIDLIPKCHSMENVPSENAATQTVTGDSD